MFFLYPPLKITNLPFGINSSLSNIQQFILHLFHYRQRIISQPNKHIWLSIRYIFQGGQGGEKSFFFRSEKSIFENSANCGILEIHFLEAKKTLFYSTLSTRFAVYSASLFCNQLITSNVIFSRWQRWQQNNTFSDSEK